MAVALSFTNAWLKSIKPPKKDRDEYKDTSCPGLVLRVTASGIMSFSYPFRIGNKTGRYSIGKHPHLSLKEAREKLSSLKNDVSKGLDPRIKKKEERKAIDNTVAVMVSEFINKYAKQKNKSWEQAQGKLNYYLVSSLGHLPIKQIKPSDINEIIDEIAARGKMVSANRVLAHMKRFFGWLVERDYIEHSPANYIKPLYKEKPRERVLSDNEIKAIWDSSGQLNSSYGHCIKLMFLCGQRESETAQLRRSQIEDNIWHLASDDTKNNMLSLVPLSKQASDIINNTISEENDYLFTSGRIGDNPINGFSKAKANLNKLSKVSDWKFHDIRRTVATNLSKMGCNRMLIKRILNHADGDVTAIYDRYQYINEKREALQSWADKLDEIVR